MSILVVGSIALDMVETPNDKAVDSPGGSALYFSSAASMFAPVNVVGVVGSDFDFGIIDFLKKRPVDMSGIYVEDGKTFRWGGRYHENMNQRDTLYTDLNVFENFKPSIPENYKDSNFIFLANIAPDLQLQVLDQITAPELVVLDTMNFWISSQKETLLEVIRKTNILILNDEETVQLTSEPNVIRGAKKILEWGPEYVIVKKGEHGAVMMTRDQYFISPAFPVETVVDPTGAGDTFAGGFVGYLARNGKITPDTVRNAVVHGNAVASFCVEDFSFRKLVALDNRQLEDRLEKFRRITQY